MIENPLSEEILRGSFAGKDTIVVEVEGEEESRRLKFRAITKDELQGAELAGVGGESGLASGAPSA